MRHIVEFNQNRFYFSPKTILTISLKNLSCTFNRFFSFAFSFSNTFSGYIWVDIFSHVMSLLLSCQKMFNGGGRGGGVEKKYDEVPSFHFELLKIWKSFIKRSTYMLLIHSLIPFYFFFSVFLCFAGSICNDILIINKCQIVQINIYYI